MFYCPSNQDNPLKALGAYGSDNDSDNENRVRCKIPSIAQPKKRGREVEAFITPFAVDWEDELENMMENGVADPNEAIVGLYRANQQMRSQLLSMRTALVASITKASTTGISLMENYEFSQEIIDELELHPRDHSHLSDEVFAEQMRAIPQTKFQAVTTTCEDPALTTNLRGVARIRFNEWIPKQERQWSNQLRISAYLYDMMIRLKESDEYPQILELVPEVEELFLTSKFAFLSCTTMRRKLACERVKLLGEAAGPEYAHVFRDRDEVKEMQTRELLDDDDTKALSQAFKRRKVITQVTSNNSFKPQSSNRGRHGGQVFGRGKGRGHFSSRHTSGGQAHNNQDHSSHHHQQQPQRRWQNHSSRGRFSGRGRGRGNFRGQTQAPQPHQTPTA
jgi:hypothetical protein